jgi:hypothetical protein
MDEQPNPIPNTLAEWWADYRAHALPDDATLGDSHACPHCHESTFYAGAYAVLGILRQARLLGANARQVAAVQNVLADQVERFRVRFLADVQRTDH